MVSFSKLKFFRLTHLERVELLIEHLAQVHGHGLVDLLPEVRAEDLDQRNFESRDLPVHEDAREVELDLEAHVDLRVGIVSTSRRRGRFYFEF